jgi:hypothetical protein
LSANISFTSGILEAQLEKMSPAKKKYNEMAILDIVQNWRKDKKGPLVPFYKIITGIL